MTQRRLEPDSRFRPATTVRPSVSARLGPFRVFETRHPGGCRLAAHDHQDANLNVVLAGGFSERIGARWEENGSGAVTVKPAGARHANRYGPVETRSLLVQLAEPDSETFDAAFGTVRVGRSAECARFARLVLRGLEPAGDPDVAEGAVYDLVFEARGTSAGSPSASRDWIRRVREAIAAAALSGAPVRLGALAADAGMSPSALSQGFRRAYGVTPLSFARDCRVRRARALLQRDPGTSLARAAHLAGFADQSHFTRAFRSATGLTPGRYQRYLVRSA